MIKRQRQKDEKGYAFLQTDPLSWDEQGQLKTFRNDRITAEYGYDGLGRRVFSKTTPAGDNLSDIRWFWWDGDSLLCETHERTACSESMTRACELDNVNGELARQQHLEELTDSHPPQEYVYYPHTFEPFALITGSDIRGKEASEDRTSPPAGQVCFYHNNVNGAPVRLTDASGDIVWSLQAGAWGDKCQITERQLYNPLRYQGQYFDNESGLHYNRYRYYEPESGRFISQDPIGLAGGLNTYAYVKNPLTWIDPLGLTSCQLSAAMEKNGTPRPANSAAHHIVPETAGKAQPARDILNKYGLLNSHENGVFLPNRNNTDGMSGILHNGKHPNPYIEAVNRRIEAADILGGKSEVVNELGRIRDTLSSANRDANWYTLLQ